MSSSRDHRLSKSNCSGFKSDGGFKQYSWGASHSPSPDEALLYGKCLHATPSVYAFRIIDEIDPQSLHFRQVGNIHIVLQASLAGSGGYLETDLIYTKHSLSSNDKEPLSDQEAVSHWLKPLYLRSKISSSEMFQPEINVSQCRLLGRRTVALAGSSGQTSLSLHGTQPQDNRWIIPFSSKLLPAHHFYVVNRFLAPFEAKSVVQLQLMLAMYPIVASGGLDIPAGNHHYLRLIATQNNPSDTESDGDVDTIVIDDSEDDVGT
jgi:hypothetical protein